MMTYPFVYITTNHSCCPLVPQINASNSRSLSHCQPRASVLWLKKSRCKQSLLFYLCKILGNKGRHGTDPWPTPVWFRYISYSTTLGEHAVLCLRRCPAFGRAGTCLFLSVNLKGLVTVQQGGHKIMARLTSGPW